MITIDNILEKRRDYIINSYNDGVSTYKLGKQFDCNPASIYLFLVKNDVEIRKRKNYGALDQYKETIIKMHSENCSAYQISKTINISKGSILKYSVGLGLDFSSKSKRLNPIMMKDQEELIKQLHESGLCANKISKQLKYSPSQVSQFLNRLGYTLTKNTHDVDLKFFDKIDNEVKAYILGFWYADGNVRKNVSRLQIADLDILERIKHEIKYTGDFSVVPPRKPHHKIQYCMNICRQEVSKQLIRLGCVQKKSLVLTFPTVDQVPKELIHHFIRGYMDGDGNIQVNSKQKSIMCRFIGTKEFLRGIEVILQEKFDTQPYWSQRRKKSKKNNFNLVIGGNIQVIKFLDWLYQDSDIHLSRKHKRYLDFKLSKEVKPPV